MFSRLLGLPAQRQSRLLSVLLGLLFAASAALLLFHAAVWTHYAFSVLGYPFDLDYEGPLLAQVRRLQLGRSLYPPIGAAPYVVTNYTPLYVLSTWLLSGLGIDALLAGRALSLAATFTIATLIANVVHRLSPDADPATRRIAAGFAALLFLCNLYVEQWGVNMRVDMLAIGLELCGLWLYLFAPAGRQLWLAAPFLVLAVYTKQTAIAAAAACLATSLLRDRREALRLALLVCVPAATILLIALLATEGQFWQHHVRANMNAYSAAYAASQLVEMLQLNGFAIAIGATVALPALAGLRALRTSGGTQPLPPPGPLTTLALYWLAGFAVSLAIGKVGSNINYFIEWIAANCVLFGLALTRPPLPALGRLPLRSLVVVLAFAAQGLVSATYCSWTLGQTNPAAQDVAIRRGERLVAELRAVEGIVLSEDMTLLYRAEKNLFYQPFEMTQLAYQQVWDPTPVIRLLRERRIPCIVLTEPLAKADPGRFLPAMLDAIRSGYVLQQRVGGWYVYVPGGGA